MQHVEKKFHLKRHGILNPAINEIMEVVHKTLYNLLYLCYNFSGAYGKKLKLI
jgi:hypothetical protein